MGSLFLFVGHSFFYLRGESPRTRRVVMNCLLMARISKARRDMKEVNNRLVRVGNSFAYSI